MKPDIQSGPSVFLPVTADDDVCLTWADNLLAGERVAKRPGLRAQLAAVLELVGGRVACAFWDLAEWMRR